jgi:carbamate kinase
LTASLSPPWCKANAQSRNVKSCGSISSHFRQFIWRKQYIQYSICEQAVDRARVDTRVRKSIIVSASHFLRREEIKNVYCLSIFLIIQDTERTTRNAPVKGAAQSPRLRAHTRKITMFVTTTSKGIASLGQRLVTSRSFTAAATRSLPAVFNLGQRLFSTAATKKQHIVVALGGNALLKRGQDMTMANQRDNIASCMASLKDVVRDYNITLVHGNGPQVGLLVLESALYQKETGLEPIELDVLDAETEGMIGYLIEQELQTYIGTARGMATILSQILVDPQDPAFENPTKFIGPIYTEEQAAKLGLPVKRDGDHWRRVVPSPLPVRMAENQMLAVRLLADNDCIVICAGGGGIPVVQDEQTGKLKGVEAVIDKDRAACMVGISLEADGLLILTDVQGVARAYATGQEKWIKTVSPDTLAACAEDFPAGSMGPKVESAIEFVKKTGGWAAIGSLNEADKVVAGTAGTRIEDRNGEDYIEFHLS